MRSVILYPYPVQPDGLSLQGELLYQGMKKNGEEVMPCHITAEFEKEWIYKSFQPHVVVGVGVWECVPDVVFHTQKFGIKPVPWLVADGWVANYHKVLGSLPLVLVTSEWVKKTYERDGVNTKNFVVAHIGFDPKVQKPIPRSNNGVAWVRKMLGIEDDEIMILTVGGDVTSKGAQEVLQALKKIDTSFKKWKYVCKMWGGDSVEQHYSNEMKHINALGESKDKVIYIEGPLSWEFMPYLLNACDIYAAPSRLEGFGMIQMEAQACGIPVISINEMGPKDVIRHGETGFLVKVGQTVQLNEEWAYTRMGFTADHKIKFDKPKIFEYRADIDDLAKYLLQLMEDSTLRKKMSTAAHKHAIENFAYDKIAKKIAGVVKEKLKIT